MPLVFYNSGTELTEDLDVDYYETYMRQYDAQTGRFTGVDLLSEATFNFSPYHYGGNDPIYFSDPSGLSKIAEGGGGGDWDFSDYWNTRLGHIFDDYPDIPAYGGDEGGTYGGGGYDGDGGSLHGGGGGSTGAGPTGGGSSASNGNNSQQVPNLNSPIRFPVFWEEEAYPDIERIDYTYYQYYATPVQKVDLGGKIVFLLFHRGLGIGNNYEESGKSYFVTPTPNWRMIQRHEVPYASTMEGGIFAYSELASASQNGAHGTALSSFYKNNNIQPGDAFLVPLTKPSSPVPQPIYLPDPVAKRNIKRTIETGALITIGFAIYEGLKWGTATLLAPETFGGSYVGAAALP